MERQKATSEGLRGLVQELNQKLDNTAERCAASASRAAAGGGPLLHNGLVSDLDRKLQEHPTHREPEIVPPRFGERVPTWLGFLLVTILGVGLAVVVVRPWQPRCVYTGDLCQVAKLDIDALRIAIPDSDLIAALPNIDELDPNDELTAGDIFSMDRFADLNFEQLITSEEIERLLGSSG